MRILRLLGQLPSLHVHRSFFSPLWILTLLLGLPSLPARAGVKIWDGSYSPLWSAPLNWSGGVAPVNGDDLVFPAGAANLVNTNNNYLNSVRSITFTGSGYTLRSTYPIIIMNGISGQQVAGSNSVQLDLTLWAAQTFDCINGGASQTFSGSVDIRGFTLTFDGVGDVFVTKITGTGGVTKNGTGTLTYTGSAANTYSGPTTVDDGLLLLAKTISNGGVVGSALTIGDSTGAASSAVVRDSGTFQIGNATGIIINSDGLLDLNNIGEAVGNSLTLNGGRIESGTGSLSLSSNANITNSGISRIYDTLSIGGGTCTISGSGYLYLYADVNGPANIVKNGSVYLLLYGDNTFTGTLTANSSGYVYLLSDTALGSTNAGTILNDNTYLYIYPSRSITNEPLTLNTTHDPAIQLYSSKTNSWFSTNITLLSDTILNVPTNSVLELSAPIGGTGGITKKGPGTLIYSGTDPNDYDGLTTVNEGELDLNKPGGWAIPSFGQGLVIGDGTGTDIVKDLNNYQFWSIVTPVTINSSGVLNINDYTDESAPLTMNGGQLNTGSGYFKLYGTVAAPSGGGGTISGRTPLDGTVVFSNNANLYVSANVSGGAGITKKGTSHLYFSASNSYTGLTLVEQGYLHAQNSWALGTTNSGSVVSDGATLVLYNVGVTNESLTLNGPGPYHWGSLEVTSGKSTWAGPVTNNANSTLDAWQSGSELHINGPIVGAGGLELFNVTTFGGGSGGTIFFEGPDANSYAGLTTVDEGCTNVLNKTGFVTALPGNAVVDGTLLLGNYAQTVSSADILVDSGGLFDCGPYYAYVDTLRGVGTINFGAGGYIKVGYNNGSSTFDGVMTGIGYAPGYTVGKSGNGTFTLNGDNTFTAGAYRVIGGGLVVNGSSPQVPVTVENGATLGGTGTVGTITAFGDISPGASPGMLTCSNLTFSSSGSYTVEINGLTTGTDYDQLNVHGISQLANAILVPLVNFTTQVALGQQFTIINNDGSDSISGIFAGYPEGASFVDNGYAVSISYVGGTGNDVVFTVTALPGASVDSLSSVTSGNGNGSIDPNECDGLSVVITNQTGTPMTGVSATLASVTPGVVVVESPSPYPDVPGNGMSTNLVPFSLSTTPDFVCGTEVDLLLTVTTASHGSFIIPVTLPSGSGMPTASPVRYDMSVATSIPDVGTVESTNVVSGFSGMLAKVVVSLWLTHPIDSDLDISLISPDGVVVDLSSGNGAGANFGTACSPDSSRTTFDDDAGTSITAGSPPFVGIYRPEGSLASTFGGTVNGYWRLRVTDNYGGTLGTVRCWSLLLYPEDCTPGSGLCELCPNVTLTSALGPSSPMQMNYVTFDDVPSVCGVAKTCPGTELDGPFPSANFNFHNGPSDACITVTLENTNSVYGMAAAVYSSGFNPANSNKCDYYLADAGFPVGSVFGSPVQSFSFNVASNTDFVVNLVGGYTPYKLTVTGGDCRPVLSITELPNDKALLDWTTAAAGYQLESTNALGAGGSSVWPLVMDPPVVVNSRYHVTNNVPSANQFYHLRKPSPPSP